MKSVCRNSEYCALPSRWIKMKLWRIARMTMMVSSSVFSIHEINCSKRLVSTLVIPRGVYTSFHFVCPRSRAAPGLVEMRVRDGVCSGRDIGHDQAGTYTYAPTKAPSERRYSTVRCSTGHPRSPVCLSVCLSTRLVTTTPSRPSRVVYTLYLPSLLPNTSPRVQVSSCHI